ncbi:MAG: DUF3458 domain-containing protein [Gammaproteobacteria bacterium]|nr:DUF3458 domain-containing protein [Gammaproteobacteria bacterium]
MRTMQFAEDAGPMAHPIRPEKVIEMNNFYTVTVYDKGAEVIRMMHTLLGTDGFRKGMDLYFQRHDGQAVTCDDFVAAMADANQRDMTLFKHWYSQSGTPVVTVRECRENKELQVTLQQSIPTHKDQGQVKTLLIPVKYELIDSTTGVSLERGVLQFDQSQQTFVFDAPESAILVLFEDFSAPVKVERSLSFETLAQIVKFASDPFARWDSMQSLWLMAVKEHGFQAQLVSLIESLIKDESLENDIKAELIAQPSFDAIAESYEVIDVEQILQGLEQVATAVSVAIPALLKETVNNLVNIDSAYRGELVAKRRLKQVLFSYIARLEDPAMRSLITETYNAANNMSEKMLCVDAARIHDESLLAELLQKMESEFKGNVLVLDKILASVAQVETSVVFELMEKWTHHQDFSFKNPNRFRALYGAFIMRNPHQFHDKNGQGYALLTKLLIELDKINPQVASRMVGPLLSFNRFDPLRKKLMQESLQTLQQQDLSKDLFEKVNAALNVQA